MAYISPEIFPALEKSIRDELKSVEEQILVGLEREAYVHVCGKRAALKWLIDLAENISEERQVNPDNEEELV